MSRIVESLPVKGYAIQSAVVRVDIDQIIRDPVFMGGQRVAMYRTKYQWFEATPQLVNVVEKAAVWNALPEKPAADLGSWITELRAASKVEHWEPFGGPRYCILNNGQDYLAQCYAHWIETDPAASPGADN